MPLFQCEKCGCVENTALSANGFSGMQTRLFNWDYAPELKGKKICSACGPKFFNDGTPTKFGKWHGVFSRDYLPLGEYLTDERGNLRHRLTGQVPVEHDYVQLV